MSQALSISEAKFHGKEQLSLNFEVGAAGVAEELLVFAAGISPVTFCYVAGHGDGGSADLIG